MENKGKIKKESKTYTQWFSCTNCDVNLEYKVKKGVTRKQFFNKATCRNCGVKFVIKAK